MASQLDKIEALIKKHAEDSAKTSAKVNDMHFILMGNKDANVKGVAQMVSDHDKYINSDRKFKWITAGALGGANLGFMAWVKTSLGL